MKPLGFLKMQKGQNKNNSDILLTELELLRFLFRDLLRISNKGNKKTGNNTSPNIKNSNNKIYNNSSKKSNDVSIEDIVEIERVISKKSFSNKIILENKGNSQKSGNIGNFESIRNNVPNNDFFFYNAKMKYTIENGIAQYGISIKYENNNNEEKLDIAVSDNQNNNYRISIIKQKNPLSADFFDDNYSIKIIYEYKNNEEKLNISYGYNFGYLQKHIDSKNDFTERVPLKFLNILPEAMMGGVLGFTYIGDPSMGRRADLAGKTARMVDIHESIHTPDEYETRVLTEWIMQRERVKYVK